MYIHDPTVSYPNGVYTNETHWLDAGFLTNSLNIAVDGIPSQMLASMVVGQSVDGGLIIGQANLNKWFLTHPFCMISTVYD